jgi:MYXO-CTERM domain-containing protein
MRRLTSALAVTAALLSLAAPQIADACSCMKAPSPVIAAKDAEAVFEGKVISVEDFEKSMPPGDYKVKARRYKVEVIRSWKGMVTTGETIDIETADNSAACGRTYELNTNYLIYAAASDTKGAFMDGLCSRTMPSDKAVEDFEALGPADGKWEPPADTGGDEGADGGGDDGPGEPAVDNPFVRANEEGGPAEDGGAADGEAPAAPQPTEPSSRGCSVGGEGAGPLGLALGLGLLGWRRRRS